jgi:hypothetical protein
MVGEKVLGVCEHTGRESRALNWSELGAATCSFGLQIYLYHGNYTRAMAWKWEGMELDRASCVWWS